MELRDFSDLRVATENIRIPLNGQVYEAEPEPAAEVVLSAMGGAGGIAGEIAKLQSDGSLDGASLEEMARTNPVLMMRVASAGMSQTERSIAFLQSVLLPESRDRWAKYMRPVPLTAPCDAGDPRRIPESDPPERPTTPDEQAEHRRHQISLRQCMAVYQALIGQYAGRPTVPPSSSENGHGGNGGTSTAGVPAGASTP